MSFFSRIFGFGDDPELYSDDDYGAGQETAQTPAATADGVDGNLELPEQTAAQIFERVVEVFNSALPDFLARSVDPERQKQLLLAALDESTRAYLAGLEAAADARSQVRHQAEAEALKAEMENLKKHAAALEARRNEIKERQLSADRQKRALSERVHDLEAQLMKLEAEREQLEIENKGLVNKAKVAGVYEKELEELRQQAAGGAEGIVAAKEQEIASLQQALADKDNENKELSAQLVAMRIDSDMLHNVIEERDSKIKQLGDEIAERDSRLADSVSAEEMAAITDQIQQFADIKSKLEERIASLRDRLRSSDSEAESLRNKLKDDMLQHSHQVKLLRDEIATLRAAANTPAPAEPARPMRRHVDTSDVDDIINDTDWLRSSPAEGSAPTVNDSDFGYQAPPKKPRLPLNDNIPSLFD